MVAESAKLGARHLGTIGVADAATTLVTAGPWTDAAAATVRELRATFAQDAPSALVGGVTATAIDTNDASIHDRNLIIPVVLAVITLILMLLLRSIVAPVLLILTTVLSFGTAMGVVVEMVVTASRSPKL